MSKTMKTLIYISIFFLIFNISFSQEEDEDGSNGYFDPKIERLIKQYKKNNKPNNENTLAYVKSYTVKEQDIYLKENGKNVKQIHIKFDEFMNYGYLTYKVTGWCQDFQTNNKYNIFGANIYNVLYLFQVDNKEKRKKLKYQIEEFSNSSDENYEFLKFKDYQNRFIIDLDKDDSKIVALYDNKKIKKKYNAQVDYNMLVQYDTLYYRFDPKSQIKKIALEELSFDYTWEIISSKIINNNLNLIMGFRYSVNPNVFGMCGAQQTLGFAQLEYNNWGKLINQKKVEVHSCNEFYFNKIKVKNKNIHKYELISYEEENNNKYSGIVTVDLNNLTLKSEKAKKKK